MKCLFNLLRTGIVGQAKNCEGSRDSLVITFVRVSPTFTRSIVPEPTRGPERNASRANLPIPYTITRTVPTAITNEKKSTSRTDQKRRRLGNGSNLYGTRNDHYFVEPTQILDFAGYSMSNSVRSQSRVSSNEHTAKMEYRNYSVRLEPSLYTKPFHP